MKKINVILTEDHPLTRQTLAYQLKKREEINLLGAFENGKLTVDYILDKNNTMPDIVLMDIDMPVMNGFEAVQKIREKNSNIAIIMLTNHNERESVLYAFKGGANGYCIKDIKIDEFLEAFKVVLEGGIWIDKRIAQFIFDVLKQNEKKDIEKRTAEEFDISEREKEVLKLVADGLSNDEITEKLFISRNTVKNHISSIIAKLSVKDRTQAAVFALKNNMFD
jgi:DNA-binding NarL/FixJ family response regulator